MASERLSPVSLKCACGSDRDYQHCCGLCHSGQRPAQTPEQLMRSRYSAYVLGEIDYIGATQKEEMNRDAAEQWSRQSEWQGLEIVEAQDNYVEFVARYKNGRGELVEHRERSRFEQDEDGRWIYVDGSTPTLRSAARTGRNDPCPCGSGKKYKKCCLA